MVDPGGLPDYTFDPPNVFHVGSQEWLVGTVLDLPTVWAALQPGTPAGPAFTFRRIGGPGWRFRCDPRAGAEEAVEHLALHELIAVFDTAIIVERDRSNPGGRSVL